MSMALLSDFHLIDLHDNLTRPTQTSMDAAFPTWSPDGLRGPHNANTRICPADFYYAAAPCDVGIFISCLEGA